MKPKLCLALTIACLMLLLGLFRLGLETGLDVVAFALGERGMAKSTRAYSSRLSNAAALTATYEFDLDGTPTNDSVSEDCRSVIECFLK